MDKLNIVDVEQWFLLSEVRNDIAHEYETHHQQSCDILNAIDLYRKTLWKILADIREKSGLTDN